MGTEGKEQLPRVWKQGRSTEEEAGKWGELEMKQQREKHLIGTTAFREVFPHLIRSAKYCAKGMAILCRRGEITLYIELDLLNL